MDGQPRRTIALLTNSEHGQANVILAVSYELLLRNDFDIHIISFEELSHRVDELNETVEKQFSKDEKVVPRKAVFHTIPGLSMKRAWERAGGELPHVPGVFGAMKAYSSLENVLFNWKGSEYMEHYYHCLRILEDINPVIAVVDPVCWQLRDAVSALNIPTVVLNPSSIGIMVSALQPKGAILWKYPACVSHIPVYDESLRQSIKNGLVATGIDYPIPWYMIPGNIMTILWNGKSVFLSKRFREISAARKEAGLTHTSPFLELWKPDGLLVSASTFELEYHLNFKPDNVIGCGALVIPAAPVSEADTDLDEWLMNRPTVLVNLGTHFIADPAFAINMSTALKTVLDYQPDIQILWKAKHSKQQSASMDEILGPYMQKDRIRILNWLKADPVAILDTGRVVCSVNHGGGNSFYEGLRAGIPQVLLPAWFDCYEFATRIEYLGCGVWANRGCAPGVQADQLAEALKRALTDKHMKSRAEEVGMKCRNAGGRELASEAILDFAKSKIK